MQYGLPVQLNFDKKKAYETLLKDKKKEKYVMNYVLLKKIGEAEVVSIPLVQLQDLFSQTL
jgi:3-dehydroquinate synthetase